MDFGGICEQFGQVDLSRSTTKPTKWPVCPVWSVFAVRMKKCWVLIFLLSVQRRLDCMDAQADLSFCWAHLSFCWFCRGAAHMKCSYYCLAGKHLLCSSSVHSLNSVFNHLMTKSTKWPVHPAKTQISLGIHPVWSESLLSAWRSYPLSAQRRLWSDWADAQADLSLCWAHTPLLVFSWGGSLFFSEFQPRPSI